MHDYEFRGMTMRLCLIALLGWNVAAAHEADPVIGAANPDANGAVSAVNPAAGDVAAGADGTGGEATVDDVAMGGTVDLRFVLTWSSEQARHWSGRITVEGEGRISDPVNLSPGPLMSGGIHSLSPTRVDFRPPSRRPLIPSGEDRMSATATSRGGLSLRAVGRESTRLSVAVESDGDVPDPIDISLAELVAGGVEVRIDAQSTLSLRPVTGQSLRVRLGDGETIIAAGEPMSVGLRALRAIPIPTGDGDWRLQCDVYLAATGKLVSTDHWPAEVVDGRWVIAPPIWQAPAIDGPYRLHWRLCRVPEHRGAIADAMSPTAWANSVTRTINGINTVIPATFGAPLVFPFGAANDAESPTECLAESTFSIAVVSRSGGGTANDTDNVSDGRPRVRRTAWMTRWSSLGDAESVAGGSAPVRLLGKPAGDWIAAASGIGRTGSRYNGQRLTELPAGGRIELQAPLARVGKRHRAILRLPTGLPMRLSVETVDATRFVDRTEREPAMAVLRNGYEGTEEAWHEVTIDYWPRSADTRIVITNLSPIRAVGIGAVEVLSADDDDAITAAEATGPRAGRLAALRLELEDLFEQFGAAGVPNELQPLDYHAAWVATERLIETLVRQGYGGVMLTVSSDGAALYPTRFGHSPMIWNANWHSDAGSVDTLELMLRLFERAGLQLLPCIRPSGPSLAVERQLIDDPKRVESVLAVSPWSGQFGRRSFDARQLSSCGLYNPVAEPVIADVMARLAELHQRCGDRPAVGELGMLVDQRCHLALPPPELVDPQTLDAFHASLGETAPQRAELVAWLKRSGYEPLQQWRAGQIVERMREAMEGWGERSLVLASIDSALPAHLVALGRDGRVKTAVLHRRSLIEPIALRGRDEACNASIAIAGGSDVDGLAHACGVFHHPVTEFRVITDIQARTAAAAGSAEGLAAIRRMSLLRDDVESALALAQLLGRSDRTMIALGGGANQQSVGEVCRRSLRRFSLLPPTAMQDVAATESASTAVRVRQGRYRGDTFVYAVNQTRWPLRLDVTFSRTARVREVESALSDDSPAAESRVIETGQRWRAELAAGELVAIRVQGEDVGITGWQAVFNGTVGQSELIRRCVQDAVAISPESFETVRQDLLVNGGFEHSAAESVSGWLTAQHPPGAVRIDSRVAFEGNHSLRLTGQSDRTGGSWIVSQVIQPPASGRLAVSLRLRGESEGSEGTEAGRPPLTVRVALEGTVAGTPIQKTVLIDVPRDGKWGATERLEIARLPSIPVESLRLTVDLMSAGVVWVDDIRLFDRFMTKAEATHWEHMVFLASGGVSRGDLAGATRLFDSHWLADLAFMQQTVETGEVATAGYLGSSAKVSAASSDVAAMPGNIDATAAVTTDRGDINRPKVIESSAGEAGREPGGFRDRLKSWLPRPVGLW